jgi:hypothetical protein
MCGVADDPLPVVLVVAVGVVACEISEGLPGIGSAEVAAAVGKGVAGLGFLGLEGTDAGGNVSELGVDVVVATDVGVEAPVLGCILDLQCEGLEDLRVPVNGLE